MSVREGVWESKREDREGVIIYEGMSECACGREGGREVVNLLVASSVFCILYSIIFRHHSLHHVMSWHIDIYGV